MDDDQDGSVVARLVFDTNVYIAAALKPQSHAAQWIRKSKYYQVFISPAIISELEGKLLYTFGFPREEIAGFIADLMRSVGVVYPTRTLSGIIGDDDDHRILECALAARALSIITADKDLLQLKAFEDITIIHPSMLKYWFGAE